MTIPVHQLLILSVVNASKLTAVEGSLPGRTFVPPMQKVAFDVCYEGEDPSTAADDIVATGTFTPRNGGTTLTDSDTLTSIRLSMTAVYEAPENPCTNRHVYGVGEKVRFDVLPKLSVISMSTVKYDLGADEDDPYETFDGHIQINASATRHYTCPISANFNPPIAIAFNGVEYEPEITIVEPQDVITPRAYWGDNAVERSYVGNRKCWPDGEVGSAGLYTTNYIGPMYVSFQGIAVSEVPCDEEDVVTGCFTNNHHRTHSSFAGAGWVHYIKQGNYWCGDRANSGASEPNWIPNSTLSWYIPVGWHRKPMEDNLLLLHADYEQCNNPNSRALILKGSIAAYRQIRHIDEFGTYRTEKFGHWISRSRHCRVILDEQVLQEGH